MLGWKRYFIFAALPALLILPACGSETAEGNAATNNGGGKGDEVNNGVDSDPAFDEPLTVEIVNASGRQVDAEALRDPLAKFVLRNEGEPQTYSELVAKLNAFDNSDCDNGFGSSDIEGGMESYVVSETAQREETPNGNSYRVVVSRKCDGRDRPDLFFSLFGVSATKPDPTDAPEDWNLPSNAEVMAFDEVAGVYNYYEINRGEIEFFGDSKDYLNGEGGRCTACHTGGGPIMKELDTPWVHWEGHMDIPGARELVAAHPTEYGKKASGSTLERLVKDGNRKWNGFRLEHLIEQNDTAKILEPLFCSVEVNLDNGTDFKDRDMRRVGSDFLFDPDLPGSGSVSVTEEQYQNALDEVGQTMVGVDGDFRDTVFTFVYPERAFADTDFVNKLQSAKIIDDSFVVDALMVDFTRPIFSERRCGLLRFAPDVDLTLGATGANNASTNNSTTANNSSTANNSTSTNANIAEEIRQGFIANLEAASPAEGTPEAEFLAHLQNPDDATAHRDRVEAFVAACTERDGQEFMNDTLRVAVAYREVASGLPVFEFPATMPRASANIDPEIRFNQTTCIAE